MWCFTSTVCSAHVAEMAMKIFNSQKLIHGGRERGRQVMVGWWLSSQSTKERPLLVHGCQLRVEVGPQVWTLLQPLRQRKQRDWFSWLLMILITHQVQKWRYLQRWCLWSGNRSLFARHLSLWSSLTPVQSSSWPQRDFPAPYGTIQTTKSSMFTVILKLLRNICCMGHWSCFKEQI